MASVNHVRENQAAWEDKEVIVTLKSGEEVEGLLDPQMGGFIVGGEFVAEADIQDINLKGRRVAPPTTR
jgi:hypothetical protein